MRPGANEWPLDQPGPRPERWTRCCLCGGPPPGDYQVKDHVWRGEARMHQHTGVAHPWCLEERIGRRLTREDFKDCASNSTIFWALDKSALGAT